MENQVITQNQEIIITENYSRAVSLHRKICANAQAAQESLFEVCKGLKEMRDGKLYKELGYQNFEDYTQSELGIKRSQAYNYISVAENLSENFVHSGGNIGVKKLALLAKLDEPERQEIIQNTDLESTSVKKLQEEIKRLKADSESQINSMKTRHDTEKADFMREKNELSKKLENKQKEFESKHKEWLESCSENATLTQQLYYAEEERDEAYDTIENLEKQIQELENRPVEVAVKDDSEEVERLKKQLEQEKQKSAEFEEKKKRIEAELEKDRNSFKSKTPDNSELFEVYYQNCLDSIDKLFAFLRNKNLKSFNERLYELSDILNDNISMLDEY
jgi:chromosome segregation ATPase